MGYFKSTITAHYVIVNSRPESTPRSPVEHFIHCVFDMHHQIEINLALLLGFPILS